MILTRVSSNRHSPVNYKLCTTAILRTTQQLYGNDCPSCENSLTKKPDETPMSG